MVYSDSTFVLIGRYDGVDFVTMTIHSTIDCVHPLYEWVANENNHHISLARIRT